MKAIVHSAIVAALFTSLAAVAAPPADAPTGTTGQCKDGSYASSVHKKGACRGHKGMKEWYGAAGEVSTPASGKAAPAAAAATLTGTTEVTPATKSAAATSVKTGVPSAAQVAPGGGAGEVWANSGTKVYHCSGERWYGKTKAAAYMSEADAKAKGFHAEHGKSCS